MDSAEGPVTEKIAGVSIEILSGGRAAPPLSHPHIRMHGSQALNEALARHAAGDRPFASPGSGTSELPRACERRRHVVFLSRPDRAAGLRDLVIVGASFGGWIAADRDQDLRAAVAPRSDRAVGAKLGTRDKTTSWTSSRRRAAAGELSFRDRGVAARLRVAARGRLTAMARNRERPRSSPGTLHDNRSSGRGCTASASRRCFLWARRTASHARLRQGLLRASRANSRRSLTRGIFRHEQARGRGAAPDRVRDRAAGAEGVGISSHGTRRKGRRDGRDQRFAGRSLRRLRSFGPSRSAQGAETFYVEHSFLQRDPGRLRQFARSRSKAGLGLGVFVWLLAHAQVALEISCRCRNTTAPVQRSDVQERPERAVFALGGQIYAAYVLLGYGQFSLGDSSLDVWRQGLFRFGLGSICFSNPKFSLGAGADQSVPSYNKMRRAMVR